MMNPDSDDWQLSELLYVSDSKRSKDVLAEVAFFNKHDVLF